MKSIRWLALVLALAPVLAWQALADDAPASTPKVERTEEAWAIVLDDAVRQAARLTDEKLWLQRSACARTEAWANYALDQARKSGDAGQRYKGKWDSPLLEAVVRARCLDLELMDAVAVRERSMTASTSVAASRALEDEISNRKLLSTTSQLTNEAVTKAKSAFLAGR